MEIFNIVFWGGLVFSIGMQIGINMNEGKPSHVHIVDGITLLFAIGTIYTLVRQKIMTMEDLLVYSLCIALIFLFIKLFWELVKEIASAKKEEEVDEKKEEDEEEGKEG